MSKKFQVEVLRSNSMLLVWNVSLSFISAIVGATIGVVGRTSASRLRKLRIHRAHEPRTLARQLDVVGGEKFRAALDARAHIRIEVVRAAAPGSRDGSR